MAQFPAGTYIFSDTAIPSGWNNQTALGGRYVLGATSASQLKTLGGAASHKHGSVTLSSVAGHKHGGSKSVNSGWGGRTLIITGTGKNNGTDGGHSHTITVNISNSLSHSHTVGETSSADNDISHTTLMLLRKV